MLTTNLDHSAGVTSFVKASYVPKLLQSDISYDRFWLTFWSITEPPITVIAVSIPMLRVLLRDASRHITTFRATHSGYSDGHKSRVIHDSGIENKHTGNVTKSCILRMRDGEDDKSIRDDVGFESFDGNGSFNDIPLGRIDNISRSSQISKGEPVISKDLV